MGTGTVCVDKAGSCRYNRENEKCDTSGLFPLKISPQDHRRKLQIGEDFMQTQCFPHFGHLFSAKYFNKNANENQPMQ